MGAGGIWWSLYFFKLIDAAFMKINYIIIKKIHLYACLSTVAIMVMFILTSYLMIHHDIFDHATQKEEKTISSTELPATPNEWRDFENQYQIKGRLSREGVNPDGLSFREYASASGSTRVTYNDDTKQLAMVHTRKSSTDAMIGIHRQRGYGGSWQYNLYAFLLDIVAFSLLIFTITGIIMWFKLLKNNKIAWTIFIAGLLYFSLTMVLLIYW